MTTELQQACVAFNKMYSLPIASKPSFDHLGEDWRERLRKLKNTLLDEVNEIEDIIQMPPDADPISILTAIADVLGDLCVFNHSEAVKFGIPLDKTLKIIMDSNKSKLGEDGNPIYNEDGKVQKGPGYWKPEPQIANMLFNEIFPKMTSQADLD